MANFSLPTLTTLYADFLAQMKQRDEDIIKMLDGTTSSNLPSGAKRWNATANKWEKYNGTSWSDLSTLYEIKVADSNKLNGQLANYYATATHTHTGYAATNHTHSEYAASGHNHDTAYLGKTAQASDSAKLGGYSASTSDSANTIGLRDTSGDFYARLFRSTYAEQTTTPSDVAHICFRNDAASDNYMRFMSSAAFKSWLEAIGVSTTDTNTWRSITDSVTTKSSVISASATAVKAAYDKASEALTATTMFSAGSKLEAISASAKSVTGLTFVKVKEISIAKGGVITVSYRTKAAFAASSYACVSQIYNNGSAVGTVRTNATTSFVTYTENINVNAGDLIQLYIRQNLSSNADYPVVADQFKILVNKPSTSIVHM